ncbi:DUF1501 domain-containing protein [Alienimonas chondri]|uniref:DUF1501 domain-containing protein n=1 Tax=Alienimonas chondri TaxID=2681879 RepID=UPI0028F446B7|nr:DUF1501 domain-containing protein [Alienimonas chondri]
MDLRRRPGLKQENDPLRLRRDVLNRFGYGLGGIALGSLLNPAKAVADENGPHFAPKAKRVIFLFQSGAPSQIDLFDPKPALVARHGEELPDSVRAGQRLTGMSAHQASLPMVGSPFAFHRHGESGQWFSELLPHTAKLADDLCVLKAVHTEAINHGPGVTMMQTGSQFPGRPSAGAWLWYGLGSANEDLPAFVVLVSKDRGGQPLVSRLWGSGFLPGKFDGVRLRASEDAVLYLNSPPGVDRAARRGALDGLQDLNRLRLARTADPALETHIAQYEMAFRMQTSIPEVTDVSQETAATLALYGDEVTTPGTYAANCLRARRLAERGVRFIQLYQPGWDHHGGLPGAIRNSCRKTDQPTAGLLTDLKQRGLLEDTLVVWGGEFGRTCYSQGKLTPNGFGRDHHPRCFTMWMAGGGVKGGVSHGSTDDFGYNVAENGVHVHDLHATLLHLLGIDHERLTYRYQGRRFRLTDVHGHVAQEVLA